MRILFLDMDGVMNNPGDYVAGSPLLPPGPINAEALKLLQSFVVEHELEVVISSTWRFASNKEEMEGLLGLSLHEDWCTGDSPHSFRGDEVREWLTNHPCDDLQYVILDDSADFHVDQLFVNVFGHIGLSKRDLDFASRLLLTQSSLYSGYKDDKYQIMHEHSLWPYPV
jgi:hypothetical protein